jgi:hypothetical protein
MSWDIINSFHTLEMLMFNNACRQERHKMEAIQMLRF